MLRSFAFKHQCLNDTPRYAIRLHILAPLPTANPESADLCALGSLSIVDRSLTHQRSGLAARRSLDAQHPLFYGGCTWETFGSAGSRVPVCDPRIAATSFSYRSERSRPHRL